MFLIFGIRGRLSVIGSGTFHCGRCGGDRSYVVEGIRRWFTFFFIPVFPISGILSRRVRCTSCHGLYDPGVLEIPTSDAMADLVSRAFRQSAVAILKAGDPNSAVARSSAVANIEEFYQGAYRYDSETLEGDLGEADASHLSIYVSPIANRVGTEGAELSVARCAQIALADGSLTGGEEDALRVLGESFNLSSAHLSGIISQVTPMKEPAAESPSSHDDEGPVER